MKKDRKNLLLDSIMWLRLKSKFRLRRKKWHKKKFPSKIGYHILMKYNMKPTQLQELVTTIQEYFVYYTAKSKN